MASLSDVVVLFQDHQLQSYFRTSIAVLLAYDYLTTLDREVSLIWASPWSIAKVLFLLTRYLPFADVAVISYGRFTHNVSPESCRTTFVAIGWMVIVGISVPEAIIILRTWALWNCSRRLGITLATVCVACCACIVLVQLKWDSDLDFDHTDNPVLDSLRCYTHTSLPVLVGAFVSVIFVETLVITLTMTKLVQHYRSAGRRSFVNGFTKVLYYDGVVFFIYMLVISLMNVTMISLRLDFAASTLVVLQGTLHFILAGRVILHLYEARQHDISGGFSMSTPQRWSTIISPVLSWQAEA